jgi:hypothetical protein
LNQGFPAESGDYAKKLQKVKLERTSELNPLVGGPTLRRTVINSLQHSHYLSYPDEAVRWTSECARVLQAGGIFSVGVPDAEWPIKAYTGDPEYVDGSTMCVLSILKERQRHEWS